MLKQIYLNYLGIYENLEKKVQENYKHLTQLDAESMLPDLFAIEVITQEEKEIIKKKTLKREKMEYLLDEVILRSLKVGDIKKFKGFLYACEESEDHTIQIVGKKLGTYVKCQSEINMYCFESVEYIQ